MMMLSSNNTLQVRVSSNNTLQCKSKFAEVAPCPPPCSFLASVRPLIMLDNYIYIYIIYKYNNILDLYKIIIYNNKHNIYI